MLKWRQPPPLASGGPIGHPLRPQSRRRHLRQRRAPPHPAPRRHGPRHGPHRRRRRQRPQAAGLPGAPARPPQPAARLRPPRGSPRPRAPRADRRRPHLRARPRRPQPHPLVLAGARGHEPAPRLLPHHRLWRRRPRPVEGWAHDHLVAARYGVYEQAGWREGPTYLTAPVPSLGAALLSLQAIGSALYVREKTGRGQEVSTSLLAGSLAYRPGIVRAAIELPLPDPGLFSRSPLGAAPFYSIYECGDGNWLHFGCLTQPFQQRAMKAIGLAEELTALGFGQGRQAAPEVREQVIGLITARMKRAQLRPVGRPLRRAGHPPRAVPVDRGPPGRPPGQARGHDRRLRRPRCRPHGADGPGRPLRRRAGAAAGPGASARPR